MGGREFVAPADLKNINRLRVCESTAEALKHKLSRGASGSASINSSWICFRAQSEATRASTERPLGSMRLRDPNVANAKQLKRYPDSGMGTQWLGSRDTQVWQRLE